MVELTDELYNRLGVEKTAKPGAIKAAYRRLVQTAHPDRGGDPQAFVDLTIAYNTLMDPKQREAYDLSGQVLNENALEVQQRLIGGISELFETVIMRANRAIEEVDVIEQMKFELSRVEVLNGTELDRMAKLLKSLHAVRSRIKRSNEERNLFIEIADKKIKLAAAEFDHISMILRDCARMREELERYTSIVDVVRTVQAGMYATSSGNWSPFSSPFYPIVST